tara:strand:- start:130 stop:1389 length:1260 start_codon:yes stop_codon:yes gene_type:complete
MACRYNEYADVSKLIDDASFSKTKHIKVKKVDTLNILKYNKKELTNDNEKTLGLFRSVIATNTGNIICVAPPKSIDFDNFSSSNKYEDCIFQKFVEGTMINVFYDNELEDWRISTRSTLDGKCNFNMDSNITYRYMFLDAMNHIGMEFYHLRKDFCYSFVLQHPKNRIVIPIKYPNLILTNVYKVYDNGKYLTNIIEVNIESLNMNKSFTVLKNYYPTSKEDMDELFTSFKYTGNSWNELLIYFGSENIDYKIQGIVIYNKNGERTKLRNSTYEKIKHLKGNSPKLQYQYYHLRQQGGVKDFLKYYPEYKEEFSEFRINLHKWTNQLYQNYINCFIKKEKALIDFPYNFKTHMYKIHEIYLYDLKPENKFVNKFVIVNYVNTLPPPRLMYSVNHNKKKFEKERRIVTSDLKVLMKSEIQ